MSRSTNESSKTTAEKIDDINATIESTLTTAFEKGLEEKYGEKFVITSTASPTMMYPNYRVKAYPESNPELSFSAECGTLKDGVAIGISDGYLTRKFIPNGQELLKPILSQYFTEYRNNSGLGQLYNPSWMDGDTTFEEFFDYYSNKNVSIFINLSAESYTPEYVEKVAPEIAQKLQEIYPIGSLIIYLNNHFNEENEKLSYRTETIRWGREESN